MRFFWMPFLISPSVMTLKNKSVDGTDRSQAITLEFQFCLSELGDDVRVEQKAQSTVRRCRRREGLISIPRAGSTSGIP